MGSQEKPTILFIHGAWHIPLHYRSLIDGLRKRGYTVLAPSLVTTGYDDSIDGKTHLDATSQVRELLVPYLDQDRKVVIAAHSYGGMVATQTAFGLTLKERAAQGLRGGVIGLVYIAALVAPEHGRPPSGTRIPFPEGWTDVRPIYFPFISMSARRNRRISGGKIIQITTKRNCGGIFSLILSIG